jgi:hypothetical protein
MADQSYDVTRLSQNPDRSYTYRNADGSTIRLSRRQGDKIRAAAGLVTKKPAAVGPRREYRRYLQAYAEEQGINKQQARQDKQFQTAYKDLHNARNWQTRTVTRGGVPVKQHYAKAGSKVAKALETLGLREQGASYDVGDTPRTAKSSSPNRPNPVRSRPKMAVTRGAPTQRRLPGM